MLALAAPQGWMHLPRIRLFIYSLHLEQRWQLDKCTDILSSESLSQDNSPTTTSSSKTRQWGDLRSSFAAHAELHSLHTTGTPLSTLQGFPPLAPPGVVAPPFPGDRGQALHQLTVVEVVSAVSLVSMTPVLHHTYQLNVQSNTKTT